MLSVLVNIVWWNYHSIKNVSVIPMLANGLLLWDMLFVPLGGNLGCQSHSNGGLLFVLLWAKLSTIESFCFLVDLYHDTVKVCRHYSSCFFKSISYHLGKFLFILVPLQNIPYLQSVYLKLKIGTQKFFERIIACFSKSHDQLKNFWRWGLRYVCKTFRDIPDWLHIARS